VDGNNGGRLAVWRVVGLAFMSDEISLAHFSGSHSSGVVCVLGYLGTFEGRYKRILV
jgi:hypothetical protein